MGETENGDPENYFTYYFILMELHAFWHIVIVLHRLMVYVHNVVHKFIPIIIHTQ